jgi:hypothetical protein
MHVFDAWRLPNRRRWQGLRTATLCPGASSVIRGSCRHACAWSLFRDCEMPAPSATVAPPMCTTPPPEAACCASMLRCVCRLPWSWMMCSVACISATPFAVVLVTMCGSRRRRRCVHTHLICWSLAGEGGGWFLCGGRLQRRCTPAVAQARCCSACCGGSCVVVVGRAAAEAGALRKAVCRRALRSAARTQLLQKPCMPPISTAHCCPRCPLLHPRLAAHSVTTNRSAEAARLACAAACQCTRCHTAWGVERPV